MFTIFILVVAFLLVVCTFFVLVMVGRWRLLPIGVGILIIAVAILLSPRFITPAMVEVVYSPQTTELAPVPVTLICPAPVVECTQTIPVVTEEPTEDLDTTVVTEEPVSEPPFDVTINGCPVGSLGTNPNTGEPLIFKMDPYPGVLCEFELYYNTQIAKVSFPDGQSPLVQDWAISCPTGPLCEGTWVQTDTVYVPAGVLVHYWVYPNSYTVQARFPTFACEYLAYGNKGHTNANIRTAPWALESGSTFNAPACVGFAGNVGK